MKSPTAQAVAQAAHRDQRVGLPLPQVVRADVLRGAVLRADPNAAMFTEDELTDFAQRAFAQVRVTAISYSARKGSYQIAYKGPRAAGTMHLKRADVLEATP